MNMIQRARSPYVNLSVNMALAIGHCIIGFLAHSWWFITISAYYAVLSCARFCTLNIARKSNGNPDMEVCARQVTGFLLMGLSVCLIGINILSAVKERGTRFHEIVMIAIAVFSFTKITMAIIGMVRAKRSSSQIIRTLRNITFADSVVSVYSLQRSMLVSFPGMKQSEIQLFNILTGTAVWILVLFLGLNLLGGKHIDMAKSRIANANQKIAEAVTGGYKKIEKGVVDGYKKIEQGIVDGYAKIEDKFVDAYLTREGETVDEAKARLRKENK